MRLYKIMITKEPETVTENHIYVFRDEHNLPYEQVTPEQHLADPELRKKWEASGIPSKELFYRFFLPSEKKLYRSRSSAQDKVDIVRRWGGEAVLLEAEVSEFIPIEEANLRRKNERNQARIRKLQDQINAIQASMFFSDFTSALKASNDR